MLVEDNCQGQGEHIVTSQAIPATQSPTLYIHIALLSVLK